MSRLGNRFLGLGVLALALFSFRVAAEEGRRVVRVANSAPPLLVTNFQDRVNRLEREADPTSVSRTPILERSEVFSKSVEVSRPEAPAPRVELPPERSEVFSGSMVISRPEPRAARPADRPERSRGTAVERSQALASLEVPARLEALARTNTSSRYLGDPAATRKDTLQVGLLGGAGIFTGGLGASSGKSFVAGLSLGYFLSPSWVLEGTVHSSSFVNTMSPDASHRLQLDTRFIPITLGARYLFSVSNSPRLLQLANPYVVGGVGLYRRQETVLSSTGFAASNGTTVTNNMGFYLGAGTQFFVSSGMSVGLDLRYHVVFFVDADQDLGVLQKGARSGNYFLPALTVAYTF